MKGLNSHSDWGCIKACRSNSFRLEGTGSLNSHSDWGCIKAIQP